MTSPYFRVPPVTLLVNAKEKYLQDLRNIEGEKRRVVIRIHIVFILVDNYHPLIVFLFFVNVVMITVEI